MSNINKSSTEKQELTSEQLAFLRLASQNRLLNFCQAINPDYIASWFHERIAEALEKALEKVLKKKKARIILTIPPRMGKSVLASNYFPAWGLGKYPNLKFILSTYGMELSETMGMRTRDVIDSDKYKFVFPGVTLRPDVKSKSKWMTNKDGSFLSVGIGTGVTGAGADCIIIDDPHKSREEAESATVRETVWDYYRSTLYTRLEGYGAVIIIMQRWHTDDLVGKVLDHAKEMKEAGEPYDDWEVINFPAIAGGDEIMNEELVRKKGESLWPEKFPLDVLKNIKQTIGVYNFESQYQQDPISSETQEFKQEMFKYYNEEDLENKYLRYYTFIDPAISERTGADNTVVLTVAKDMNGPGIYRIKEDAGHFTPQQTIDILFKHYDEYRGDVWLETIAYQKALKYSVEEEQRKRGRYFSIKETKRSNKEVRIRGLLPLYERGVVYHRKTDVEYETELLQFPKGKRDDRADCCSFLLEALDHTGSGRAPKQFIPKHHKYGRSVV
jgi:hypothetical protein